MWARLSCADWCSAEDGDSTGWKSGQRHNIRQRKPTLWCRHEFLQFRPIWFSDKWWVSYPSKAELYRVNSSLSPRPELSDVTTAVFLMQYKVSRRLLYITGILQKILLSKLNILNLVKCIYCFLLQDYSKPNIGFKSLFLDIFYLFV